ncbi:MAG TPA: phenylalanine--tRNA ligase subunit alpha [Acidimicrobiales bacterium]|jgi:phenylalanyl-tRNA synthetase alpha chain|nr:phenylalanine--tRNA ligase subunit alpha [Acidimicrobiales bacterium]
MSSSPLSSLPDQTTEWLAAIEALATLDELREAEAAITGKRSAFAALQRSLGSLDPDERKSAGAQLQEARRVVVDAFDARRQELERDARRSVLEADRLDLGDVVATDVDWTLSVGHPGLVAITQQELEDVFVAMGFRVAEGPEVETDWYNFEALNIPPAHPARGMWDTFYVDLGEPETVVLRTHTSPSQIHLMEQAVATDTLPIHAVMPGRCYRRDTPDASHLYSFHQIEGLIVDRGITFGDLAGVIETFTRAYFGNDISSRLRPGYFPFTEPSAEFEITCTICRGEGCRTCSFTGWIELGGCGMLDPAVLAAVGIDADVWSGFAFGFGIDRCAQMRHQLNDMRALTENDTRFLEQLS